MIKIPYARIQQAATLVRTYPGMTQPQFYATVTANNPFGYTQDQMKEAMQLVTKTLVDCQYVADNEFDTIAGWIRALPLPQLEPMLQLIYKDYSARVLPLLATAQIDNLEAAKVVAWAKREKFAGLTSEDVDINEGYKILKTHHEAQWDQMDRQINDLRGLVPEDLIEV
jgi:hypothetical protein